MAVGPAVPGTETIDLLDCWPATGQLLRPNIDGAEFVYFRAHADAMMARCSRRVRSTGFPSKLHTDVAR